jgi:protein-S-isoprenylcysteine O-methyltransferase Ste14
MITAVTADTKAGGTTRTGRGHDLATAYGVWTLVVINSLVFILFAFSFTRPRTARDWRSLGGFAAFVLALFTEMYGMPLTIYLLWGWLARRAPGLDLLSHDAGHLWPALLGWHGNPHWSPIHLVGDGLIGGGFLLLAAAWGPLHSAQRAGRLATSGPYAWIRHPQYTAFLAIMLGFLLQWPTLLTLAMFPLLAWMYVRLARTEERECLRTFGEAYQRYTEATPAFIPRLRRAARRPA